MDMLIFAAILVNLVIIAALHFERDMQASIGKQIRQFGNLSLPLFGD